METRLTTKYLSSALLLGGLAAFGWLVWHEQQGSRAAASGAGREPDAGRAASSTGPANDDPLDVEDLAFMDSWIGPPLG